MPVWASLAKQQAAKGYGAELLLRGESLVESISIGRKIAAETQRLFIHPYDDEEVMAGQGTIGLEITEDLPDVDYIFVPAGGGGLIAGIAAAAKAIRPAVHVAGVQSSACPSAPEALRVGRPVDVEADERGALADAIMVTRVGEFAFPILQRLVDEIALWTKIRSPPPCCCSSSARGSWQRVQSCAPGCASRRISVDSTGQQGGACDQRRKCGQPAPGQDNSRRPEQAGKNDAFFRLPGGRPRHPGRAVSAAGPAAGQCGAYSPCQK